MAPEPDARTQTTAATQVPEGGTARAPEVADADPRRLAVSRRVLADRFRRTRTRQAVPPRRQPRFGDERRTGSHVKKVAPWRGSWTPRASRPAWGRPIARDARHSTRWACSSQRTSTGVFGGVQPSGNGDAGSAPPSARASATEAVTTERMLLVTAPIRVEVRPPSAVRPNRVFRWPSSAFSSSAPARWGPASPRSSRPPSAASSSTTRLRERSSGRTRRCGEA